ncbi:hypothetical protein LVY72_08340 [Arthrobacter sp. I2-34]|uniref:WXG100 family type VII secretion target n=1 Tax=Arthrobacter hankyongi TaxID=2904801 RepID=A0ABS9L5G8_9MICC|nr:hypothetical protein [Arthrobacter hankyongi]MCG2621925.1 hypothetical protein [Arthrobacter hankyongi]
MDFFTTGPAVLAAAAGREVRLLAQRLLDCEARLLELNGSLAQLELVSWESRAGEAFRQTLAVRRLRMDDAADSLRAAAGQVAAFGEAAEQALAQSLPFR